MPEKNKKQSYAEKQRSLQKSIQRAALFLADSSSTDEFSRNLVAAYKLKKARAKLAGLNPEQRNERNETLFEQLETLKQNRLSASKVVSVDNDAFTERLEALNNYDELTKAMAASKATQTQTVQSNDAKQLSKPKMR